MKTIQFKIAEDAVLSVTEEFVLHRFMGNIHRVKPTEDTEHHLGGYKLFDELFGFIYMEPITLSLTIIDADNNRHIVYFRVK